MRIDGAIIDKSKFNSSFLSCEKDFELILKRLFVNSEPFGDELKRLLVINNPDCLDNKNNPTYEKKMREMTLGKLKEEGYVKIVPKIEFPEHEELKSYLLITFDGFTTNANNEKFRDCLVTFDIICHTSCWDLGNFRLRPLKIAGYIDGLLNNTKLTGIGTFQFANCSELILNDEFSGYTLSFYAIHGSDDRLV